MKHPRILSALVLIFVIATEAPAGEVATIGIGSKRFTESYILGEVLTQVANRTGEVRATHKPGLGNTGILFAALRTGAIDLYTEYTGTIAHELLRDPSLTDLAALNRALAPLGLVAFAPLGFSNTYALAVRADVAAARKLETYSDLRAHPDLRFGLSQEFISRKDGWAALRGVYGFTVAPRGLEHGLAYEALDARQIDVMDIYSTDAKQVRYRLAVLIDDRKVFPDYQAIILARADLRQRAPATWAAFERLAGTIDERKMTRLNAAAELDGLPFKTVAEQHLGTSSDAPRATGGRFIDALLAPDLARLTAEHLYLVMVSLTMAIAVGVPLGIWAERRRGVRRIILASVAVVQTIPALALLAFLIPIMAGIGTRPALVALFLYSLLPIVRNTLSGLQDIPVALRESAHALGFAPRARLMLIELPLAVRAILAGIKTSAVLNVGTATIAAFIGAGGYGERIASGLALNDNTLLLAGAIPAAAMALVVQWLFDLAERRCLSPGLRMATRGDRQG